MQRLYTSNELAKAAGCSKATVGFWVDNGWVKPCRISGDNSGTPDRFYTRAEYDRVMNAVREADGHPRKIFIYLNRTLNEARDCNAVTFAELASRCGRGASSVRKALARLGYPKWRSVGVLEEDVEEVKAMLQTFQQEGVKKRRMRMSTRRSKPVEAGNITLHVKGLTISLDRKAAEALAEEILEQI